MRDIIKLLRKRGWTINSSRYDLYASKDNVARISVERSPDIYHEYRVHIITGALDSKDKKQTFTKLCRSEREVIAFIIAEV